MLLLKKHLCDLVRAGRKRQTIRFWTRPIVFPGQISFTPGLGKMKILRVEELAGYGALTPDDAHDDGFDTLEELLAELKRNYPEVPPGKRLYRVIFQWPVESQVLPKASTTPAVVLDAEATVAKPQLAKPALKQGEETSRSTLDKALNPMPTAALDGCMSMPQRELLRNWIIDQKPHAAAPQATK